jgi:hypothetical protein
MLPYCTVIDNRRRGYQVPHKGKAIQFLANPNAMLSESSLDLRQSP